MRMMVCLVFSSVLVKDCAQLGLSIQTSPVSKHRTIVRGFLRFNVPKIVKSCDTKLKMFSVSAQYRSVMLSYRIAHIYHAKPPTAKISMSSRFYFCGGVDNARLPAVRNCLGLTCCFLSWYCFHTVQYYCDKFDELPRSFSVLYLQYIPHLSSLYPLYCRCR